MQKVEVGGGTQGADTEYIAGYSKQVWYGE